MTSQELRRHLAEHHYAESPPQAGMNEELLMQVLRAVHDAAPKQGSHPTLMEIFAEEDGET